MTTKQIKVPGALKGRYMMEAVKPNGERRLLLPWFDNLILDSGLNRLGSGGIYDRCMVGTSSTPVSPTQTYLISSLATTTNVIGTTQGVNTAGGYAWNRRIFRFGVGAAAGNLNEVGVGWGATDCFSRALTADSGGTPVTVTVLADEFLDVTYELQLHWPTTDVSGLGSISGTEYTVTTRAASVGSWVLGALIENGSRSDLSVPGQATSFGSGALGDVTVDAGGAPQYSVNMSYAAAYLNNSYERRYRAIFDGTRGENAIHNLRINTPFGIFKSSFSPSIPKAISNTLTLDYKVSWARKVDFVGVNPTIGTLESFAQRFEGTLANVTVAAQIEFRPDGSIYSVATGFGGGVTTEKIGEWYIPNTTGIGSGYKLQFTSVSSPTPGSISSNATAAFESLSAVCLISLQRTSTADFDITVTANYTIQTSASATVATGTLTLRVKRES